LLDLSSVFSRPDESGNYILNKMPKGEEWGRTLIEQGLIIPEQLTQVL